MKQIVITRDQFLKLKEAFESNDIDILLWKEESPSGIGPNVTIEFMSEKTISIDITDVSCW